LNYLIIDNFPIQKAAIEKELDVLVAQIVRCNDEQRLVKMREKLNKVYENRDRILKREAMHGFLGSGR
jgi:hypothetical protein